MSQQYRLFLTVSKRHVSVSAPYQLLRWVRNVLGTFFRGNAVKRNQSLSEGLLALSRCDSDITNTQGGSTSYQTVVHGGLVSLTHRLPSPAASRNPWWWTSLCGPLQQCRPAEPWPDREPSLRTGRTVSRPRFALTLEWLEWTGSRKLSPVRVSFGRPVQARLSNCHFKHDFRRPLLTIKPREVAFKATSGRRYENKTKWLTEALWS